MLYPSYTHCYYMSLRQIILMLGYNYNLTVCTKVVFAYKQLSDTMHIANPYLQRLGVNNPSDNRASVNLKNYILYLENLYLSKKWSTHDVILCPYYMYFFCAHVSRKASIVFLMLLLFSNSFLVQLDPRDCWLLLSNSKGLLKKVVCIFA